MGHLRDFDPDIFISYAHVDGVAVGANQPGWATSLHRALETKLAQLGVRANIFFDRTKLAGNDYFGPELEARLRHTAVFVSVLSPGYANSHWCLKELEVFCDAASATGGLRRGNKGRIFKVHKLPLEPDRYPPSLARDETAGYQFYEVDPETGVPLEVQIREDQRLAMIRITQLARDIEKTLQEIDAGATGAPAASAGPAPTVYLARASYDLADVYEQVRTELVQRGAVVLPDTPLPQGPEFRRVVAEQLARAGSAVHLVGGTYGMVPEAEEKSVIELQLEAAAERAQSGAFKRFVWMPPGLAPSDERQRRLVTALRGGQGALAGVELFETPIEELKTALQSVVAAPEPAAPAAPATGGADGAPLVYVICDPRDRAATAPLREFLYANGCDVLLPLSEGTEAELLEDHHAHLRDCDGVVVYCGQAGERWWREQLSELRKAPGYGRTAPMRAKAFYFGPPETAPKQEFLTQEALVIRAFGAFDPASLGPFVARLRSAGA